MRKLFSFLLFLACIFLLCGCGSQASYDDGYWDGYAKGQEYVDSDRLDDSYNEGYFYGYEKGYDFGYDEGSHNGENEASYIMDSIEAASFYAFDESGYGPDEAIDIIDAYMAKIPIDGNIPIKDEYDAAIESLRAFYGYFDREYFLDLR